MKETWNDIVKDLIVDQGLDCAYCLENRPGKITNKSTQGAHALVYKRVYNKRKKHKDINVRMNFLPCCDDCAKFSETYRGRCYAWQVLCSWYGRKIIEDWHDGMELKVKQVFE